MPKPCYQNRWDWAAGHRREIHRRRRAIEAVGISVRAAAIGQAGGGRIQEKISARSTVDVAGGVGHAIKGGCKVPVFSSAACACALPRPLLDCVPIPKIMEPDTDTAPGRAHLRQDDGQAIVILRKHPHGILQLSGQRHRGRRATRRRTTEIHRRRRRRRAGRPAVLAEKADAQNAVRTQFEHSLGRNAARAAGRGSSGEIGLSGDLNGHRRSYFTRHFDVHLHDRPPLISGVRVLNAVADRIIAGVRDKGQSQRDLRPQQPEPGGAGVDQNVIDALASGGPRHANGHCRKELIVSANWLTVQGGPGIHHHRLNVIDGGGWRGRRGHRSRGYTAAARAASTAAGHQSQRQNRGRGRTDRSASFHDVLTDAAGQHRVDVSPSVEGAHVTAAFHYQIGIVHRRGPAAAGFRMHRALKFRIVGS